MSVKTKIVIEKDPEKASCITHTSVFHADEVMATAIIAEVSETPTISVSRVSNVGGINLLPACIVYDIGCGKFDHHQRGGNGCRENDVPYSSCGLIWKEFGIHLCHEDGLPSELIWEIVDETLIQGIDASDCGVLKNTKKSPPIMNISGIITGFNKTWDSDEDNDEQFRKAVEFSRDILRNTIRNIKSKVRATALVEKRIKESDGEILILERFMPWINALFSSRDPEVRMKSKTLLYVIYPSIRSGWQWQVVPIRPGGFEQRNLCPENWCGLTGEDIQKISVKSATFVHPSGFTGGAEIKEDCIEMAKLAIKLGNRQEW